MPHSSDQPNALGMEYSQRVLSRRILSWFVHCSCVVSKYVFLEYGDHTSVSLLRIASQVPKDTD